MNRQNSSAFFRGKLVQAAKIQSTASSNRILLSYLLQNSGVCKLYGEQFHPPKHGRQGATGRQCDNRALVQEFEV